MKLSTIIAASITVIAGAGFAASAQAADQCFFTRNIQNYSAPNDHTLYLRVNVSDIYRLDLAGACPGLPFALNSIALQTVPGSSQICRPLDVDLRVHDAGPSVPCIVSALQKLSPQDVAAIPKKDRP